MKALRWNPRYFAAFVLLTCIEVCIALFVRDAFVRPYLGDVLVIPVVYCFARAFLPAYRLLPSAVLLFAVLTELSQALDLVARLGLQGNAILSTILGSTFDWTDLLCYFCGFLLITLWQRREGKV